MLIDMGKIVRLRVGELLKERNMSNVELAEKAGISPLTARMLAKGQTERVDLQTISKVCTALNVTPGDLFSISEE